MSPSPKENRVAVIIVNYNGGDRLACCMTALQKQIRAFDRCVLVDNASELLPIDGSEPWLKGVELVRAVKNLGFAAANNMAVQLCQDVEWIAFLNPDAYASPNWLQNLMQATRKYPQYASFACRQLDANNTVLLDGAGDGLSTSGRPYRRGAGLRATQRHTLEEEIFSPCGAAALYQRDIYMSIGGFDEDFFCYLEDIDLGFRLQLQGHKCMYLPNAIVHHEGSAITGLRSDFSTYHGHRNLAWVYLKNMPTALFWLYLPEHLLITLAAFIACSWRGQGGIFLKSKYDALSDLPKILRKRSRIQKARTSSLTYIHAALTSEAVFAFDWIRNRISRPSA